MAAELANVCAGLGFFLATDSNVSLSRLESASRSVRGFFDLPLAEKMKISIAQSQHHRGYFPLSEEKATGSDVQDLKEGFDMAVDVSEDDPFVRAGVPFYGPNIWPTHPSSFAPDLQYLFAEFRDISEAISGLFAIAWALPPDFFGQWLAPSMSQMRAVRYPPQDPSAVARDGQIGCGKHTDWGIVSIIWQIDEPGLQISTRAGAWVDTPRQDGVFVCMLGDMTEVWTNGVWLAPPHRVVNLTGRPRHAVAFFCDPDHECQASPLPCFVGPDRPAQYAPLTMGARVQFGFDSTFTYRL
jgi:isopenicillin N synthase-like dioxygenase